MVEGCCPAELADQRVARASRRVEQLVGANPVVDRGDGIAQRVVQILIRAGSRRGHADQLATGVVAVRRRAGLLVIEIKYPSAL